jgi:hypothetical protein
VRPVCSESIRGQKGGHIAILTSRLDLSGSRKREKVSSDLIAESHSIFQDVMMTDEDDEAEGGEWCPRDDLKPLVVAKCQTMRLLVNNCLANVDDEGAAKLVAKLLLDTLDQDGSFSTSSEDEADRDRLKDPREG